MLDPATPEAHRRAVADFFAHDEPDFLGWCGDLQQRLPGLYPAEIVFAADEADLAAKIADADGVVVEGLRIDAAILAGARRLAVVHKFGTIGVEIGIDIYALVALTGARWAPVSEHLDRPGASAHTGGDPGTGGGPS